MSDWKPNIFGYLDYRKYLSDYYEAGKEHTDVVSFRYLSRRAGFSSPNFFKLVMDGERNLGGDSPERIAKALDLSAAESRFFKALIDFDQASTPEEKDAAFETIAASRNFRRARRIDHDLFEYLSHWYYPAIREMAARADFRVDAEWIGEQLVPPVTPGRVKKALGVLRRLGLLVDDGEGGLTRGEPSLTTGHEVQAMGARNFHREMIARAGESISIVDRDRRDISALTVCIDENLVPELKTRIQRFRETLLALCDGVEDPQTVYQINIQLFPLTQPSEETE